MSCYSVNSEWKAVCEDIIQHGSKVCSRGMNVIERMGSASQIDMSRPIFSIATRKLDYRFMIAEAMWILLGQDRLDFHSSIEKNWAKYSDDGIKTFGAYGPKFSNQVIGAINTLSRDPGSRQAVINYWRENPPESKDIPCTLSTQFLIRNDELHLIHTMRSSDMWLGYPYDVFNFCMVATYVCLMLRQRGMMLGLGFLHFNAGSQHIYTRNLERLQDCLMEEEEFPYSSLDITEFPSPHDFLSHLSCLMNGARLKYESFHELAGIIELHEAGQKDC